MYIDTPLDNVLIHLLLNIISNFLPLLQQVLQNELSAGVLEDGIGDLRNSDVEVLHPIVCITRVDDSEVDCCIDVDGDVVLSDDILNGGGDTCLARSSTLIFKLIIPNVSVQGLM